MMKKISLIFAVSIALAIFLSGCTQPLQPKLCSDGIHYFGERWKAEDGCNTCTCGSNGGIACTAMYCIPKAEFEVHEWGVLAACSESSEAFITSRPKQLLFVKQPVVYVHSKGEKGLFDAAFEFMEGKPTDTYPEASIEGKRIEWKNVEIIDSSLCEKPSVKGTPKEFVPLEGIIDTLNDVDADCLEAGNEREKFLFYEGEMEFGNPIEVVEENLDENEVKVKNNSTYSVFNLFYVSMKGTRLDFMNPMYLSGRIDELKAGEEKTIGLSREDKSNFIEKDLLELGFTEKETKAFTSLWNNSFFTPTNTPFKQLVYRLPQEQYNELIKSDYEPKPKKEIRALYVLFDLSEKGNY